MKNNKGFISMSLVYSFLVVFVAISISLLAIYTENIMKIRKLNNEIKEELMIKGNERIVVLENLVKNGSFETLNGKDWDEYWSISGTGCYYSSKVQYHDIILNEDTYGQSFYDVQSIEAFSANCRVSSIDTITMVKDHVYYVEWIYNAGGGYGYDKTSISFVGGTTFTPELPHFKAAKPLGAGWMLPSNTSMGTVNVDLFKFTPADGEYKIAMNFTDTAQNQPIYVDGLMLIDLTVAVGKDKADSYMSNSARAYDIATRVWKIKGTKMGTNASDIKYTNQGYYEGRKAFSALGPNSIK